MRHTLIMLIEVKSSVGEMAEEILPPREEIEPSLKTLRHITHKALYSGHQSVFILVFIKTSPWKWLFFWPDQGVFLDLVKTNCTPA